MSTYCPPCIVLSTSHALCYWILTTTLWEQHYFRDEKVETGHLIVIHHASISSWEVSLWSHVTSNLAQHPGHLIPLCYLFSKPYLSVFPPGVFFPASCPRQYKQWVTTWMVKLHLPDQVNHLPPWIITRTLTVFAEQSTHGPFLIVSCLQRVSALSWVWGQSPQLDSVFLEGKKCVFYFFHIKN